MESILVEQHPRKVNNNEGVVVRSTFQENVFIAAVVPNIIVSDGLIVAGKTRESAIRKLLYRYGVELRKNLGESNP